MENPFPGMNPYLERDWQDLHQRFITHASEQLAPRLPRELRVRVQQRVFVESPLGAEPVTEGYIEIIEPGSGRRVVTIIEVLSIANKQPGPGQELYLRKQKECLAAGVNLFEIDLLRYGDWILAVPETVVPPPYRGAYRVCVRRGARPIEAEFYHLSLRERLPVVSVPLREQDADVPLDLQAPIVQSFRSGVYDDLDYAREPDPPLEADDAKWADELLRSRGLR